MELVFNRETERKLRIPYNFGRALYWASFYQKWSECIIVYWTNIFYWAENLYSHLLSVSAVILEISIY